jgi:hypothetical protein
MACTAGVASGAAVGGHGCACPVALWDVFVAQIKTVHGQNILRVVNTKLSPLFGIFLPTIVPF